jgi:hypothetical protein
MTSPDELLGQLARQAGMVGAALQEASAPKRYEYALKRWEDVNEYARQGWVVQQGLGSWNPEDGHVTVFLLVRPLTVADEAAELLGAG